MPDTRGTHAWHQWDSRMNGRRSACRAPPGYVPSTTAACLAPAVRTKRDRKTNTSQYYRDASISKTLGGRNACLAPAGHQRVTSGSSHPGGGNCSSGAWGSEAVARDSSLSAKIASVCPNTAVEARAAFAPCRIHRFSSLASAIEPGRGLTRAPRACRSVFTTQPARAVPGSEPRRGGVDRSIMPWRFAG